MNLELDDVGTIVTAGKLLSHGQISAVELTQFFLDRIQKFDARLHSFITVAHDRALAAAKAADDEILAGAWRGPLHGIPFAVKDVYDVAGLVTTGGSKAFARNPARCTATAVARLEAAGAILLGKLATHELTHGGVDDELPWPPVRNPWNTEYDSGGSSSGAGASVAAALCSFALGTDTGGSIRKPAAMCGVTGLKPTFGRVSRMGVMLNASTLDHCGPMASTALDCAIVLQAIAGRDEADPESSERPVPDFSGSIEQPIRGFHIGVVRHFWERDIAVDPEVGTAVDSALEVFKQLGADINNVDLDSLGDYHAVMTTIQRPELHATYGEEL